MRQLTLSTDKDKYGIRLKAEPDHMVLGKRLKGAFKSVTASIRELTSEQLEVFQKTGTLGRKSRAAAVIQAAPLAEVIHTWVKSNGRSLKGQRRRRTSLPAVGERQQQRGLKPR